MKQKLLNSASIVHDKVPNRIRFFVPLILNRRTMAELLKQSLLKNEDAPGIYHAEPNIVTGSLLVKYHPAFHTEEEMIQVVKDTVQNIAMGDVEILTKHKNPRVGKMQPGAFFTRELFVSILGNVIAGIILAVMIAR